MSDWIPFKTKTPEGNSIEGFICTTRNSQHGSLNIINVNGRAVDYIVNGMPKLGYLEEDKDYGVDVWSVATKLDGSNVIFYPLRDGYGHIIECVPKTRNKAVADNKFLNLIEKCDEYESIKHEVMTQNISISCELIGYENKHEILYDFPIKLVKLFYDGRFQKYQIYEDFTLKKHGDEWEFHGYPFAPLKRFKSFKEAYDFLANEYEISNQRYGHMMFEGAVLYGWRGHQMIKMLKCKPQSVREGHMFGGQIPKRFIRKALHKYKDEHNLIEADKKEVFDFVVEELTEEFNKTIVDKSTNNINKVIEEMSRPPVDYTMLNLIASELLEKYPDYNIPELMRAFVKKYPQYKFEAKTIHLIFKNRRG